MLVISHAIFIGAQDTPVPLQVPLSTKHYGPDGPWQAVSVFVGTPWQQVDLYPGGTFETILITKEICEASSKASCGEGGFYDPLMSTSADTTSIDDTGHSYGTTIDWTIGAMFTQGNAEYAMDLLKIGNWEVPSLSIRMITNVSMVYPDGTQYPCQLGQLALGASVANQTFAVGHGEPTVNASLIPSYLQVHEKIPSASYGLHIGSAALSLPMSLWLGGYDASRIIGPVSSQSYSADIRNNDFLIDLLDIGIGVDNGGSPFAYAHREGILAEGNTSIATSVSVAMNPAAPYLYLPNSTCAAITKDLPVTYSAKYGLYMWDTTNPNYMNVVTSPTYLSFIFRLGGDASQNITIKVPFRLLNLTLDAPLVSKPTPYFPCTTPQNSSAYSLGRAFLQAAFIGVNWDQGVGQWFLAQAPGPNTPMNAIQKSISGTNITGSDANWTETWRSAWTSLPDSSHPKTSKTPGKHKARLSSGSVAAVVIGSICGLVFLLLAARVWVRRKRRAGRLGQTADVVATDFVDDKPLPSQLPPTYEMAEAEPSEIDGGGGLAHELDSQGTETQQPSRPVTLQP